jgi:hypothetical protein
MQKRLLIGVVLCILISAVLSGCQETTSVKTEKLPQNVYLDSTIVEFKNASFEKHINKSGGVESVTVGWLFHNIAGRTISAIINVKFYDNNNILLYNDTKEINYLPAGFTEQLYSGANKVTFVGEASALVDHVVISVVEI